MTLPLYNGDRIGFMGAHVSEEDIIRRIAWHCSAVSATADLRRQREQGRLSSLAAHHLRIEATRCVAEPTEKWPAGSFNKCVPIRVDDPSTGTTAGPQAGWDGLREDAMRGRGVYLDAGNLPGHTHTPALRLWLSEWPPRELAGLVLPHTTKGTDSLYSSPMRVSSHGIND